MTPEVLKDATIQNFCLNKAGNLLVCCNCRPTAEAAENAGTAAATLTLTVDGAGSVAAVTQTPPPAKARAKKAKEQGTILVLDPEGNHWSFGTYRGARHAGAAG